MGNIYFRTPSKKRDNTMVPCKGCGRILSKRRLVKGKCGKCAGIKSLPGQFGHYEKVSGPITGSRKGSLL